MRRFLSIAGMVLLMAGIPLQAGTKSPYSELIATLPDEDSDADGLTNAEEGISETNPTNPDCDGDGVLDGADGWAWEPALSPPRLAEVQYAVVDLGQTEPLTANYSQMVGLSDDCTILFVGSNYTGLAWNLSRGSTTLNFHPNSISRSGQYVCGDAKPTYPYDTEEYFNNRDYVRDVTFYRKNLWTGGLEHFPHWTYEFEEVGGEADPDYDSEEGMATAGNSSGTTLGYVGIYRRRVATAPNEINWFGTAGSGINFITGITLVQNSILKS